MKLSILDFGALVLLVVFLIILERIMFLGRSSQVEYFIVALVGFVPGLLTAIGGAWKDTLYEPFELTKFFRSPTICMFGFIVLWGFYGWDHWVLSMMSASTIERLIVEGWKAIIRHPPGKFQREGRDSGWLKERLNIK
jgi:hypothetical protein